MPVAQTPDGGTPRDAGEEVVGQAGVATMVDGGCVVESQAFVGGEVGRVGFASWAPCAARRACIFGFRFTPLRWGARAGGGARRECRAAHV